MAYATLTASYTEIAADITALTIIQVPRCPGGSVVGAELVAAASAPEGTVRGVELWAGQTMTSAQIPDLGASGKLYGRLIGSWPAVSWGVLTK